MDDENFEVVYHHGGRIVNDGSLKYVGDSSTLFCDLGRWSFFEIMSILREMGVCECEGIMVFSRWGFCVGRKVGVAQ